jgi:hypothetical protein
MSTLRHIWSPDDWEQYCDGLCRQRHGATGYVRVPDRDRGDLGLEGFSIDGTGIIYQAYATDEVDVGKRYEKQRDKMTKDLGKLVRNADRVAAVLGDNVVKYWVLLVPVHDSKDLIAHARTKEQEMRGHGLPFITGSFQVLIHTEADFAAERAALDTLGMGTIPPSVPLTAEAAEESIDELKADQPDQVKTMDDKLRRARVTDVAELRERLLRQVVEADNIRDHLRVDYPSTSERVLTEFEMEESAVLLERDFNQLHRGSVVTVRERLSGRLAERVPALPAAEVDRLAYGQVGRWLLECPLDFPQLDG